MTLVKDFLTPAATGLMDLLPLLIIFVIFIHIYYVSVLFISNGLSLVFRDKGDGLPDKLSGLFFNKTLTVILYTILPVLMLAPLYRLTFFESGFKFEQYLFILLVLLAAGLVSFSIYRRKNIQASGAFGTLAVLTYIFLFSVLLALFLFPEKWPFIKGIFPFPLFSITPIFVATLFISISFINTGAALGFIYLSWGEMKLAGNSPLSATITKISRLLILVGTLTLPPVLFLFLFTLPGYSMGKSVFLPTILTLLFTVLSAYTAFPLTDKIKNSGTGKFRSAFIFSLLLTLSFSVLLFSFQKYSNIDKIEWAKINAEKKRELIEGERMELYSKSMKISSDYGEQIYKERCTSCHDFEKTILGPAFNNIIPKYSDNPENMVKFILDPVKIDPNLPSMPDPGLTTLQAKSVTKFILGKDKKSNGEKSE